MKNNVIQFENCPFCGPKDLIHFFHCLSRLGHPQNHADGKGVYPPRFDPEFRFFFLIPLDRNSKETFVDTLIFGNSNLSFSDNITVLKAATVFIVESGRFD